MRIHIKYFLKEVRNKYSIEELVAVDGYIYYRIKKEVYGLKQTIRLAHDQLVKHLAKYGYELCTLSPQIWKHRTRLIKFCLCVDDFGVKYFNKKDVKHLVSDLRDAYKIIIHQSGIQFYGLQLQ